jgi:ribonuclease Z
MEDLEIMAGSWALERIDDLLNGVVLRGKASPVPLRLTPIRPGVIFEDRDFSVTAFPVYHRGPDCFGFVFQEQVRRPFLPEKAEALNIPPGPWRRLLVDGSPADLPDGRTIRPEEVLGEPRPGTRLVHIGDVGRTDDLLEVCRDADALVIESTYLEPEAEMARDFAHLTALGAARLAEAAGVKTLLLTHLSRRYRERDVYTEARSIFPETYVARDFDHFQVKRGESTRIDP